MLEFRGSEELQPLMRVICTKDPKISLNFLSGSFGLSICLRMICCGEAYIIFENLGKFSGKCRGKLETMIRDNCIMQSEAFEHVVEKELGNSICVDDFRARS